MTPQHANDHLPEKNPTLRVAFDVRMWEMSGLGVYANELLGAFARGGHPIAWTLVGPERLREQMPTGLDIERWEDFDAPIYSASATLRYPDLSGVDLFHYPHYNMPMSGARRSVVNVFDLFHLRYSSWFKRRYQGLFLRRLRWSRARIVTACEKTRQELKRWGGIKNERVEAIEPGPGHRPPVRTPGEPAPVQSLGGTPLRPPWILVTGIDQPHKNLDFLFSSLALYFQRRPDAPSLVWVGGNEKSRQRRGRRIPAQVRSQVAFEPFSDRDRVEGIFAGAGALVFPSLDEGFGFPPLEAMERGVPVLCARREPMLTLLGDAPLYFEPTDPASLWRILDRLIDLPGIHDEVVARGLRQSTLYSWETCADRMYDLYRRMTNSKL